MQRIQESRAAVSAKSETAEDPYVRQLLLSIGARMDTALAVADAAPHPNGGGWVAATATVAPTAFVGPGAMVLDSAMVRDNASVEQYAIVRGKARISGHARVGGQAFIKGSARLSGYQRAWYSVGPAGANTELPELTPRDGSGSNAHGLWQNYALDETSVMMLEDRYRDQGVGGFSVPLMNGYVRGAPKLVVDEERRAFAFDGKTQYLELNARAADMGQITVDMAVRPSGRSRQTLWDFGSDAKNCMTLKTDVGGRPVFTATAAGKPVVTLPMTASLAGGVWTRLRVEIDGKQVALWDNDRLSAKMASTLRPADVFPSGRQKRNFVAASRDGKEHFAGAIDYVVIYHRVHGEEFTELPPPVIDAGRRPTQRFAAELIEDRAARKRYEIENNRAVDEAGLYYGKLAEEIVIRLHELRNRDPNWQKAIARAKDDLANIGKSAQQAKQAEPQEEIAPPPQLLELRKQKETLQQKIASYADKEKLYREGEAEWIETIKDPEYLRLKARQQAGREELDKLGKEVEASFETMPEEMATKKHIAELTAQRGKLDDVVNQVDEEIAEAVAKMPVYWDGEKIEAENRFLRELRVQYEGEHGSGGGGAIQGYRSQQERRKQMAKKPAY